MIIELFRFLESSLHCFAPQWEYGQQGRDQYMVSFNPDRNDYAMLARIIDSIANDVDWPLLAEQLGHRIGYAEAHGLYYRTIDEYGAAADSYDLEPLQWIRRIEIAAEMAKAMRPYLRPSD